MKTISAETYIKEHNNNSDPFRSLKPQYEIVNVNESDLDLHEIIDEELDNEPTR